MIIYELKAAGRVFYIGRTSRDINTRLIEHLSNARSGDTRAVYVFLRKKLKINYAITIKKIDDVEDGQESCSEQWAIIQCLKRGIDLTNMMRGSSSKVTQDLMECVRNDDITSFDSYVEYKKVVNQLSLDDQVMRSETRYLKNTADVAKLSEEKARLTSQNENLQELNRNLADENKILTTESGLLITEFETLSSAVDDLKLEAEIYGIKQLKKEVKNLNKDIGNRRNMIDEMAAEYEIYKQLVDEEFEKL